MGRRESCSFYEASHILFCIQLYSIVFTFGFGIQFALAVVFIYIRYIINAALFSVLCLLALESEKFSKGKGGTEKKKAEYLITCNIYSTRRAVLCL